MDFMRAIEDGMVEAGLAPEVVEEAIERMMDRPARDYRVDDIHESPLITEMVAAGLSTAVAARIVLNVFDEWRAVTTLPAIAADEDGCVWSFADELADIEEDDGLGELDDDLDGRSGEFNFLGFRFSCDQP